MATSRNKSVLSTLEFTIRPIKKHTDPILQRRGKLVSRLNIQLEMAKCLIENEVFTAYKEQWVTDQETGIKDKVKIPKRIRSWFYSISDIYYFDLKYGSKPLEASKGKATVVVGEKRRLTSVIQSLIGAVEAGELDTQLATIKRVGKK
ncbi:MULTISPECIES: DUF6641 family protein [Colwellia]|uniref:Uncharacterized protein n=1 Tax=Colwellia marinimaniae TaxID=1513592 RepID=A0ABQ0MYE7_9GAMM|nr:MULTISPECIES: DUF6641 family protein [Colwellia]GAW96671.1 hypothetical protein MTCD1_02291 [Colwellia marinimaniae]